MYQSIVQAIHNQLDNIPPLPETGNHILSVTADPNSSANDLMQVILPDQIMCGTILKLANSVALGQPKQVHTIKHALMVLGVDQIKNITIGKAVFSSFPKMVQDTIHGLECSGNMHSPVVLCQK